MEQTKSLDIKMRDAAVQIARGDPGAMLVALQLVEKHGIGIIDLMNNDNIRGPLIWIMYRDVCEGNLENMAKALINGNARELLDKKLSESKV